MGKLGDSLEQLSLMDDYQKQDSEKKAEIWSISDLNRAVKSLLEGRFQNFWVQGEISNFKAHSSGHFYFSLKDDKSQIRAVMFRGFNGQLKFRPNDGMEVLVRGRLSVYEPRGDYQVFCEVMEPLGAGALQLAFEQLKRKLESEGLFDKSRKRRLPRLPHHVAIVTSPTGAAIRDMIHVLGRRFRGLKITVIPTKVQGDQAPDEIVSALSMVEKMSDVDVVIVGRGGGSIEDLWAFNEERVARAIAACSRPTISAVGHEVDFTIADFVADLRAPTPSAAAEVVVQNREDLIEQLKGFQRTLRVLVQGKVDLQKKSLLGLSHRLIHPGRRLQDLHVRCDDLCARMESGLMRGLKEKRSELLRLSGLMDSLSPLRVVERGYSILSVEGSVLRSTRQIKVGSEVEFRLGEGRGVAVVKSIGE